MTAKQAQQNLDRTVAQIDRTARRLKVADVVSGLFRDVSDPTGKHTRPFNMALALEGALERAGLKIVSSDS